MCNFCGKFMKGRATRAKQHLMEKSGNVSKCPKCSQEVKDELWECFKQKKKQEKETEEVQNVRELDLENLGFGLSEDDAEWIDETPNLSPKVRMGALKAQWIYFIEN